ncbi:energy transducer TonB [Sphingomonas sp. PL-96]|uniref:energy transducer TonB n=1 Tax=Sphingomonas sp. PL-96 TaxID=2887201 RepID=UPI001E402453|nr:energy transducer TonB [Sphingomonas sp. PL-96]MCC2975551.1 energy transducer TonB [Sphingomonas sp. PL-96]
MKRMLLLAAVAAPFHPAASQSVPSSVATANVQRLAAWMPGELRCGGALVTATTLQRPWTALHWSGTRAPAQELRYRFRIDATGRPMSVRREGSGPAWGSADVAPSLAVSRFPAAAPHADCTLAYSLRQTSLADAPVGDLISYSLTPLSGRLAAEGWARIQPPDTSCLVEPRPRPLMQAFPDFLALPGTPGVKHWSMLAYDLDRKGRPIHVRVASSTGDPALDRAAAQAMRASRFAGGARTGCLYPMWRGPTTVAAPEAPAEDAMRPTGSTCPHDDTWVNPPRLRYAQPYHRRSIEGWAVIAFDVAPWGALGNLRVLASEPTEDFGTQALQVIGAATKPPSATGRTGCVERVLFKIGYGGLPAGDDPA